MQQYKTLSQITSAELTEKRSRFIAVAAPVTSEQEITELIDGIKKKHFSAKHTVYAFRLKSGAERYSEDGEPQGTSGAPILDLLRSEELTDCVVAVTRYFGGVLLGKGGLVRAYTGAAKAALEPNPIKTMQKYTVLSVECDYSLYGKLEPLAAELGGGAVSADFSQSVTAKLKIPSDSLPAFNKKLSDLSGGSIASSVLDEIFC